MKKTYAPKYGTPLEHAIVRGVLSELRAVGWKPTHTFTDDYESTRTDKAVMDAVFSTDESTVSFRNKVGSVQGVKFISGNDADIISDYHCGEPDFSAAMDRVQTRIEAGYTVTLHTVQS